MGAGRAHPSPRAAWSSTHRATDRSRQLQPPFCAGGIGVDLRDGAVHQDVLEVRRLGHGVEQPLPDTGVRSAPEPRIAPTPLAEHLRQITPTRRVFGHPQDRIHEQPVVNASASPRPGSARKMALNSFPLRSAKRESAHGRAPSPALNQSCRLYAIPQMQTAPRLINRASLRSSSRIRPLKLSTKAFWAGSRLAHVVEVRGLGNRQHLTDRLNPMRLAVILNERDYRLNGGQARLGEICARLAQDLVGLPKLAILTLWNLQLFCYIAGNPGPLAVVDLGLIHPIKPRMRRAADLCRYRLARRPAGADDQSSDPIPSTLHAPGSRGRTYSSFCSS